MLCLVRFFFSLFLFLFLNMFSCICGRVCWSMTTSSSLFVDTRIRAHTSTTANFFYEGGSYRACGNSSGSQLCPTNYVCLRGNSTNPNYGFSSFDTVYRSFFVVFRVVQRDFWEETMQYLIAAAGPWHIFLFVALIYIVSFQLCALIWSPIAVVYNYLRDEQWEKDLLNDLDKVRVHIWMGTLDFYQ